MIKQREYVHPDTGEVTHVPVDIDPGFDWNPGQSRAAGLRRAYNVYLADLERMGVADRVILSRIRVDIQKSIPAYWESLPAAGAPAVRKELLKKTGNIDIPVGIIPPALHARMGAKGSRLLLSTDGIIKTKGTHTGIKPEHLRLVQTILAGDNVRAIPGGQHWRGTYTDEAGREYTAVWKLTLDSMEVRLVSMYFSHRKNRKKGG